MDIGGKTGISPVHILLFLGPAFCAAIDRRPGARREEILFSAGGRGNAEVAYPRSRDI
jgi:hypothetical protein